MGYEAAVLLDSISPADDRLTTMEISYPRIVHAEFMTHRVFSRNSASSRAVPIERQLELVLDDPFIPEEWGVSRPGMQATENLDQADSEAATGLWLAQRDFAVLGCVGLFGGIGKLKSESLRDRVSEIQAEYGREGVKLTRPLHKQLNNRLLEPYMWHRVIVSATDWSNFFALRAHPDAQPQIQLIAQKMRAKYQTSVPRELGLGEWHIPMLREADEAEYGLEDRKRIAVGRLARVSYLTHNGTRDPARDIERHNGLLVDGHMSPFEHVARPMSRKERWFGLRPYTSNFRGWHQYRKDLPYEYDFGKISAAAPERVAT